MADAVSAVAADILRNAPPQPNPDAGGGGGGGGGGVHESDASVASVEELDLALARLKAELREEVTKLDACNRAAAGRRRPASASAALPAAQSGGQGAVLPKHANSTGAFPYNP